MDIIFVLFAIVTFLMFYIFSTALGIMSKCLINIKKNSPELYKEILGDKSDSWIERGGFFTQDDKRVQKKMFVMLYKGDLADVVGAEECERFSLYVKAFILVIISFLAVSFLAFIIVLRGW